MTTSITPVTPSEPVKPNNTGITNLQDILAYLLSYRISDFYARFASALPSMELSTPLNAEGKTRFMMGVTFIKGHHVLLYNPLWVEYKLTQGRKGFEEVRATIAHEAQHVLLMHIARTIKLYRQLVTIPEKQLFNHVTNLAADAANNDLLVKEVETVASARGAPAYKDLHSNPDEWIFSKTLHLPEDLTYEWYISLMMDPNKCVPGCKGGATCNGQCRPGKGPSCPQCGIKHRPDCQGHGGAHDKWIELAENMTEEEAEVLLTQIEQDAYEKMKQVSDEHKRARGTVPGHVEQAIQELLKPPEIPWKKLMHQFVTRCRMSRPLRSMERPRKRWGMMGSTIYPGTKRDRTFNLVFAIDTSGSMSDGDLLDGLSELQGIQRIDRDTTVTVIEFDCAIHKEYKLHATDEIDVNLRGRGGTDFNAAFNRAKELAKKGEVDAIIMFTDGYAPAPQLEFRPRDIPVLWCLTDGGTHPCPDYGFEIRRPGNRRNQ